MRYYRIQVSNADGSAFRTWTSLNADGSNNQAALNVELDVPVTTFATPMGDTGTAVRIWGIPWSDISQAADFNGKTIQVFGGMAKGLPLANPRQQGLLFQGKIFQAWGNWVGTGMALDFNVIPDTGTDAAPANIQVVWKAGQPLSTAIANTLSAAFPSLKQEISISPSLVVGYDVTGSYKTAVQFARWLQQMSQSIVGGTYSGVSVLLSAGTFKVYDGTTAKTPKVISFLDLIGQPTWLNPFQVQAITVMRADIGVSDYVTLPPGLQTIQPQGQGLVKNRSTFSGTFQVDQIRHAGIFRQPDAGSWVSVYNMHAVSS